MSNINNCSIELNTTFDHTISNYAFGNLSEDKCREILKDGRPFAYFIEHWLAENFPLSYIGGCKSHDFVDENYNDILYDEKTFTKNGCSFCPSSMKGTGRTFNQEEFEKKTKKLIFCIVSNIDFPNIKIKFMKGEDLLKNYPRGNIPSSDHIKFFN